MTDGRQYLPSKSEHLSNILAEQKLLGNPPNKKGSFPVHVNETAFFVMVLHRWAAELHHNYPLILPPQRERERKYSGKGSQELR